MATKEYWPLQTKSWYNKWVSNIIEQGNYKTGVAWYPIQSIISDLRGQVVESASIYIQRHEGSMLGKYSVPVYMGRNNYPTSHNAKPEGRDGYSNVGTFDQGVGKWAKIDTKFVKGFLEDGDTCFIFYAYDNSQSGFAVFSNPRLEVTYSPMTPPTGPISITITPSIITSSVAIRCSGYAGGYGTPIKSFTVYGEASPDQNSWRTIYSATHNASASVSITPDKLLSGEYFRVRVTARSETMSSSNIVYSNIIRRNLPPGEPEVFTVSPLIYNEGDITIKWSGSAIGTSAIKSCFLQISTSDDNETWSAYSELANIDTTETSGEYTYTPTRMEMFTRYRMRVFDILDEAAEYVVSDVVRKNTPPEPPLVVAPKNESVIFNPRPIFLITMREDREGEMQTIGIKTASGAWQNSVDNADMFSKNGELESGLNTIYKHEETPQGKVTVTINSSDSALTSKDVARTFTVAPSPFAKIEPNISVVKAAHMLTLKSAVNAVRDYYGLTAFAWVYEIVGGKTEIKEWGQHVLELREAIDAIIEHVNNFDPGGVFNIAPVEWVPTGAENPSGGGRPRADVMNQLQEIILEL